MMMMTMRSCMQASTSCDMPFPKLWLLLNAPTRVVGIGSQVTHWVTGDQVNSF